MTKYYLNTVNVLHRRKADNDVQKKIFSSVEVRRSVPHYNPSSPAYRHEYFKTLNHRPGSLKITNICQREKRKREALLKGKMSDGKITSCQSNFSNTRKRIWKQILLSFILPFLLHNRLTWAAAFLSEVLQDPYECN